MASNVYSRDDDEEDHYVNLKSVVDRVIYDTPAVHIGAHKPVTEMASNVYSRDDDEEEHYVDIKSVVDRVIYDTPAPVRPKMLAVAAIDFGTTFSGVAYSFVGDYERQPLQIDARVWHSTKGTGVMSHKTPTCLLLSSNKSFEAFGYDAEDQYAELAEENAHYGYRYFKNFKMLLHTDEGLKRDAEIKDEQGHALPAMLVFSECIKYLRDETMKTLKTKGDLIRANEVRWVITMPAIWGDSAKQFMREAAEQAGIERFQLVIALEPEAASIFTKEQLSQRKFNEDGTAFLAPYDPGTKYMVVDLGGGTVDITIRQVLEDRTLREVHQATGGAWGGMGVNANFLAFISELVGDNVLSELRLNHKADYLELERSIEMKKRHLEGDRQGRIMIPLPAALMEVYADLNNGAKLTNKLTFESKHPGKVDIQRGHLRINKELVAGFFKPAVDNIVKHLREDLLTLPEASDLVDIILVGGFADSKIIKETITEVFSTKCVVVPEEAGLAVLKGAVLYGQNPNVVKERISKFTYGTRSFRHFLEGFDSPEKETYIDGQKYCGDCFGKIAEVGMSYTLGDGQDIELSPVRGELTRMCVDIYKSTAKEPVYVTDEGCSYLGRINVDMSNTSRGKERSAKVRITFGDTELICEGIDEGTGKRSREVLDTLSSTT
ncbi:heat shock 70 kDa protein 12A-like isoform X3 [Mizuhopecten yessoensis]|nr:heat shock 70 kDa protein 12A-like isoform X1 [Mizuhopecten yessoensis]XP_021353678.1 heat shock 70 kDa protein 12A-like isoform X2 [Mizuhopecten yessoensis]XP_021353679.1 heat shock 70 kDa protein 12A-like isoform X3 [Mizuhopecten yessoensis]